MLAAQGLDGQWCLCFLFLLFLLFVVSGSKNGMFWTFFASLCRSAGLNLTHTRVFHAEW